MTKKNPVKLSKRKLRQTSQAAFAASSFSSWFNLVWNFPHFIFFIVSLIIFESAEGAFSVITQLETSRRFVRSSSYPGYTVGSPNRRTAMRR